MNDGHKLICLSPYDKEFLLNGSVKYTLYWGFKVHETIKHWVWYEKRSVYFNVLYPNERIDHIMMIANARSLFLGGTGLIFLVMLTNMRLFDPMVAWFYGVMATLFLLVLTDIQAHKKSKVLTHTLSIQLPTRLQKIALLMDAGLTTQQAVDKSMKHQKDGSLLSMYDHQVRAYLHQGIALGEAMEIVAMRYQSRLLFQLARIINRSMVQGSGNAHEQLNHLAILCIEERKRSVKRRTERLGTQLLFPMMLSLIAILAVITVPIWMQLGQF